MGISINDLHLNDRWLTLLQELAIDQGLIEVKMKGMPKAILKPEILLILSIKILSSHCPDVSDLVTVINR